MARTTDNPPTPSIQTKVRTPLPLPNYTLWLWNSDISDLHPWTWPVCAALLVVAVFPLAMYSCQGRTTFRPWWDMKTPAKLLIKCKWSRSSIKYYHNMDESLSAMFFIFFTLFILGQVILFFYFITLTRTFHKESSRTKKCLHVIKWIGNKANFGILLIHPVSCAKQNFQ